MSPVSVWLPVSKLLCLPLAIVPLTSEIFKKHDNFPRQPGHHRSSSKSGIPAVSVCCALRVSGSVTTSQSAAPAVLAAGAVFAYK